MIQNRTTARTIEVIQTIAKHPKGLTHLEIADMLKMPQTSTYDILQTLVHYGILDQIEGKQKKYILGIEAFVIGNAYLREIDVVEASKQTLEQIADQYIKNVHIAIPDKTQVVYIYRYKPEKSLVAPPEVGEKKDIYCTALGKVILSTYSDEKLEQILDEVQFIKHTEYTIENKEMLLKDIQEIRERGFSIDNRENDYVTYAVAAPVYKHGGELVASISMAGFYVEQTDFLKEGQLIKKVADEVSAKLGYIHSR